MASANIDRYLGFDHKIKLDVELPTVQFKGKHECGRCELGEREAGERIHDWNLVEQGLTEEEARQEASRCLRCDHFGFGRVPRREEPGMVELNNPTVSDNTESGALNMVKLTIDNCEVVVPEHTTILDAAKSVGIQIPTLCYLARSERDRRLPRVRGRG